MTEISVSFDEKRPVALVAEGHSGYAERGEDIVCAGVSALLQALLFGFENVAPSPGFSFSIDEDSARMVLDWRRSPPEQTAVLVETIVGSLKEIARVYPEHVRILEVRVDEMGF